MAKKNANGEYEIPRLSLSSEDDVVESPIEEEGPLSWEAAKEEGEAIMLPPTVSTYSHRDHYVPPPPDHQSLKKDLVDALETALHPIESAIPKRSSAGIDHVQEEPTQGFYEVQGVHILDTTTLAIRAARLYYTMHPNPERLNSIKSDYQLRRDLMSVLDVLKKWAGRKFAGGLREEERLVILVWVSEVGMMIDMETKLEDAERQEREGWTWMDGSLWDGKVEQREHSLLTSLLRDCEGEDEPVPEWTAPNEAEPQTAFLKSLADGRRLVKMHNSAVKRSKKQFCHITSHHSDIVKPYRRADNLRYWTKAAELRWEVKPHLNVLGVANSSSELGIWTEFETAIFTWCQAVREELTRDWKTDEERKLHFRAKSLALASPGSSPKKRTVELQKGEPQDELQKEEPSPSAS